MKSYQDKFVVAATFSEDGPEWVSPLFNSFGKASDWRYSSAGRLHIKRLREGAIGRITGMDEEMDLEAHVARIQLTRTEKRRKPRGWVERISAEEQHAMDNDQF